MKYRIAENRYNIQNPPWRDAVGIEDISEGLAVPSLICWFTRGDPELPQKVVDLLNEQAQRSRQA